MRILLVILSLLFILPVGTKLPRCIANEENQNQDCIFYRYLDCIEATRQSGKSTVLVLYSDPHTSEFKDLQDIAHSMGESVLCKYANFLILSPQGVNILIYPPMPDPMLKEIAIFQQYFPEVTPLQGTFLITLSVSQDTVELVDIAPIDFPS
ncbi:hypothetical protein [Chlamydia gallinacea]|uniref:hypothetical protein n=1 Tax=Chlamydia gallinacea TaxID=1457153 RepID=UPI0024E1FFCC|nr:hypothetical protein [Chlamydia gallinacea]